MAVEAGKAYVSVSFEKSSASRVGGQLKSFVGGLAAFFAAKQIFDFGKQAVEEAAQVQKSTEAIRANFGKSSDQIVKFNENAASSFGISNAAGTAFAAQMGLVTTNLNLSQKQGAGMTVGLEKLAGAFGLIKGQDPANVFGKLQKALLGNTRGLKDMGIAITPFAEKQEALTLGIKRQSSQWNANEKAQIIYGIAMKHLPELMDQAKKHSGDLADQQIKLSAQWSNMKEQLGAELLPILTRFGLWLSTHISIVEDFAIALIGVAVAYGAYSAATAIATIATEGFTVALLANPVGLIAVGIVALGVAVVLAYKHFATFRAIVQAVLHATAAAIDFVRAHWHLFLLLIPGVGIALALIASHFSTFKSVAVSVINAVKGAVSSFIGVIGGIGAAFMRAVHAVASALGSIKNAILRIASEAAGWAYNIGRDIITGIIQGIVNNAKSLADAAVQAAKDALDATKSFLHIGSPSRLYADEVGAPIAQGVAMGITDNAHHITNALGAAVAPMSAGGYGVTTAMNGGMGLDINVWLDGHRIDDRIEAKLRRSTKAAQAGQRWSHA